ncbi:Sel1 repeat family protein [Rhizophagus clarus]|uniref:Sel1 repeat family protein n=1 Tax=Rhizophagus clarus TaxID=94130 RepID=A0A8H3M5F8_9GLOM|nr:Sel1 repeat family protein [Rhizophagus clarus]
MKKNRLGKGVEKDEVKAFKYYEILAKQNIVDAQLQLGNCLYNEIGTKANKIQAKFWYEKAANNGNIIAKNFLKEYYNKKTKVRVNKSKEFKFYEVFFLKNLCQRGLYYLGKMILKTNYEKSFYYFQKAAENGCKFSQFNLGGCYQLGNGVRKDIRKAFELFKKSAKQGYINAQSQLIYYYGYGLGTETNRVKAYELVKLIAEKGYKHAIYLLGLHYKLGVGVDKDEIKAFELFKKLADETLPDDEKIKINEQNDFRYHEIFMKYINSNIYYQLGDCYEKGIGAEFDKAKAFESYKIAAEKENNIAQYNLGYFYENGEGVEKDLVQAIFWYNKAADGVYNMVSDNLSRCRFDIQCRLDYCYCKGLGTEVSKVKAFELELYKEASDKENKFTQNSLNMLHKFSESSEINLEKAIHYWYYKRSENRNEAVQHYLNMYYQIINNEVIKFKQLVKQEYVKVPFKFGYCYFNKIIIEATI